ncbi:MAG: hypothetical protein Q9170_003274 [Blastenia crenularia]
MAAAVRLPGADQLNDTMTDQIIGMKDAFHVPESEPSPLARRRFGGTFRCDVEDTRTILVITTKDDRLWPYRISQVLKETRNMIRRQVGAHGDRPLIPSEIPFVSVVQGIRLKAYQPPNQAGSLTGRILDDTIEPFIFEKADREEGYKGQIELAKIYDLRDTS